MTEHFIKRTWLVFITFFITGLLPLFTFASLVPNCTLPGDPTDLTTGGPCRFQDLITLYQNVMGFLLSILIPIAILAIAFIGIQYLTALGNPSKLEKVHETAKDVLWGILIALAAYAIINTIFKVLTQKQVDFWFQYIF
ncbi:MAG: hypothetical protein HY225_00695 [Candidatus Vogelbacteria bacterium]|nr:hypothetical protein [Candidatus Vogelbacteria bacterium]